VTKRTFTSEGFVNPLAFIYGLVDSSAELNQ
jgi:hypothetical protein